MQGRPPGAAQARGPGQGQGQAQRGPGQGQGPGPGRGQAPGQGHGPKKPRPSTIPGPLQDPFTPIKQKPSFGKFSLYQKTVLTVCLTAITIILSIVFGTDWIHIPGRDLGALVRHNVDFLADNITLPKQPVEATWQMVTHDNAATENANTATQWQLTAVMEFSAEDTAALLAEAKETTPAPGDEIGVENWFPAPVAEAVTKKTVRYIDPSPFFGGLYQHGAALHIEGTNSFVVQLATH